MYKTINKENYNIKYYIILSKIDNRYIVYNMQYNSCNRI